ncbi:MAG TPA: AraC family transcriptional regulator [Vicinamibacterales bacterium]|jgi:AraC-like DNA-binding protein
MPAATPVSVEGRRIEDIDAMAAAAVDGLTSEYLQLVARPFTGRWTIVRTSHLSIQIGCEDIAVVRRLGIPSNRAALIVPLSVPDSARWNACVIRPQDVLVCLPGAECYAFDPGGTSFAVISVESRSPVARRVRLLAAEAAPSGVATLRPEDACALRRELQAVGAASRAARTGILKVLQLSLARAVPRPRQIESAPGRSQIVRRAEEFFKHHVGEPVSIARLSSVAGVSERSLRNAFYDMYTTSPKRYLRLWQLHQVRRALRSVRSDENTVTDVATLHGFYELGRFAGEYKALFGEAPSHTLQKARTHKNIPSQAGAA